HRSSTEELFRELNAGHTLSHSNVEIQTKAGERRIIDLVASIYTEDGREIAQLTFRDITERTLAHQKLKASEEMFHSTVEQAAIVRVLTDLNGQFLIVNRTFCTKTGYSEKELLQKTFQDLPHREDVARNASSIRAIKDGTAKWFIIERRCVK